MDEDMGIMYRAVDENYEMAMQYKYTWNKLQHFGQFHGKRIWKNFTYFIDWMEQNWTTEKFFEVIGKSYDLEDSILFRIQKTDSGKHSKEKAKRIETWLMSNIFRHVANPKREENPLEPKYIGKVEFTKIHKRAEYEGGPHEEWSPPVKDEMVTI